MARQQLAQSAQTKSASGRVMSDKYFVRVDGPREFLEQKFPVIGRWIDTDKCLAIYHQGSTKENPHTHFVISFNHSLQKQTFDLRIKSLFDVKGTQYSTKTWDGKLEGAGSYMLHENVTDSPDWLFNKNFTDNELDELKVIAGKWKGIVDANKQKAEGKIVAKLLAHFEDQLPTKLEIWTRALRMCKDGENHFPGYHRLKTYVDEAYLKLLPDNQFEKEAQNSFNLFYKWEV